MVLVEKIIQKKSSDLTKRVDNNSDNILELRNNDEYLNNKIDNYLVPKFYPSGKRSYTTTHSISNLERSDSVLGLSQRSLILTELETHGREMQMLFTFTMMPISMIRLLPAQEQS